MLLKLKFIGQKIQISIYLTEPNKIQWIFLGRKLTKHYYMEHGNAIYLAQKMKNRMKFKWITPCNLKIY